MSLSKSNRAKLLDQLINARLSQLEAATAAQAKLDAATAAIEQAQTAKRTALDELRTAYEQAIAAGWTETDLATIGVTKPRRASGGRPRKDGTPPAEQPTTESTPIA